MRLLSSWSAFLCVTLSAGTAMGMPPRSTPVATPAAAITRAGCPAEAAAKQAAEGLLALGCAVAEWLNGAVNYFGDLAAPKNQRSTAKGLRHFADDLAAIERDKRSLIATLRRGGDTRGRRWRSAGPDPERRTGPADPGRPTHAAAQRAIQEGRRHAQSHAREGGWRKGRLAERCSTEVAAHDRSGTRGLPRSGRFRGGGASSSADLCTRSRRQDRTRRPVAAGRWPARCVSSSHDAAASGRARPLL